jgi:hypothetical protein
VLAAWLVDWLVIIAVYRFWALEDNIYKCLLVILDRPLNVAGKFNRFLYTVT